MKKIIFSIIAMIAISVNAQNDVMYIMKDGNVVGNYNIKTQVDSIIFYKPAQEYSITVKMTDNALNGDLYRIASNIDLEPGVYDFEIDSTTARFGTSQTAWEGVFLYTHEIIASGQPAPNFMTSLNGIGIKKTIDLSNYSTNISIQGFMISHTPTYDDSGEVKVKVTNKSNNDTDYLIVKMVDNALNGDLNDCAATITLPPGKYSFKLQSTIAKFATNQTAWEGVFIYTHEVIDAGQPAPNHMTTLNGVGNSKIIDLSNLSSDIVVQCFMVPHVPTYDDSGEVVVVITAIE